jgi:hypothetical protein
MRKFNKTSARAYMKKESLHDFMEQEYLELERYSIQHENEFEEKKRVLKIEDELTTGQIKQLFVYGNRRKSNRVII